MQNLQNVIFSAKNLILASEVLEEIKQAQAMTGPKQEPVLVKEQVMLQLENSLFCC